jgi:hypothetical protein
MAKWSYAGSSVVGHSHLSTNVPCQDKHRLRTSQNGNWIAISVSDGAGSAEYAEKGAEITSEHFCTELIKLSHELESKTPGEWINDFVVECVLNVRKELRNIAHGEDLKKFHCTLVAALMGPTGGFAIHIGDGAIFGGAIGSPDIAGFVELNNNFVISKPENGEYSNETYFITESNWIKHLRITPLPKLDWIIGCTDGGASLLLEGETEVKPTFLCPFLERQINEKDSHYINEVISDPKANKLTTDDKTIVVAIRSNVLSGQEKFSFTKDLVSNVTRKIESTLRQNHANTETIQKQLSKSVVPDSFDADLKRPSKNKFKNISLNKINWRLVFKTVITVLALLVILISSYFVNQNEGNDISSTQTHGDVVTGILNSGDVSASDKGGAVPGDLKNDLNEGESMKNGTPKK